MFRTQVYLTKQERESLTTLTRELGQNQSELIREAIDQFIQNKINAKHKKQKALHEAAGIWAGRNDIPDLRTLRSEFDRR